MINHTCYVCKKTFTNAIYWYDSIHDTKYDKRIIRPFCGPPCANKYREISSCSNFSDFQARRANIKIQTGSSKKLAHTINGSALAVGRTLVALIENNYNANTNSIKIPDPLKGYYGADSIKL